MNVWTLTGANRLEKSELPLPESVPGKIKVRVTKVMIGGADVCLYNGSLKAKYPIVPGRFAVGLVADENGGELFPKGTRVLLHTFRPAPDTGTAKKDFGADDVDVCGITRNGFLSDFVLLSPDEMTPLPDSVGDNDALLVHHVALAKAVVDRLDAQKGSHIAVVGGDRLGILISLLLIYQQVSPILIDNRADRIEFAKKCGVYYSMLSDENLLDSVASITGGRLTEGAVFVINADGNDSAVPFRVSARDSAVVLCGLNRYSVSLDLETAIRKQISVYGVSDASDYLETAINLIANKAVDLGAIRCNSQDVSAVEEVFDKYRSGGDYDFCEANILNLV